jgi:GNAT superfamily N-acetyltransferase
MSINYRFYEPADLEQTVDLINATFNVAPVPYDYWARLELGDHVTAVAEEDGQIIGAIPFDLRSFLIRPGTCVRGAFAHAVAVSAAHRNRGIGSAIMDLAKRELRGTCQALFVYTGGEGHQPYTFYQRNGFHDLMYNRRFTLTELPADVPADVSIAVVDHQTVDGEALLPVFQAAYAACAGFPEREPGFWRRALDSEIFYEIPQTFHLAMATDGTRLTGHGILGMSAQRGAAVLELAARPEAVGTMERLLLAMAAKARCEGASELHLQVTDSSPAIAPARRVGFRPAARHGVLAGQVLDFAGVWRLLGGAADGPGLHIWTPEIELDLPGPDPSLTLEMKGATLHRLLLCREDLLAALRGARVTTPEPWLPLAELENTFRPAVWQYHHLDWI